MWTVRHTSQYGPEEEGLLATFDGKKTFGSSTARAAASAGRGASKTNGLHRGELDSHHVFLPGWDAMLLEPVPPYNVGAAVPDHPSPTLMSQYEFSTDWLLLSRPWYVPKEITAHFMFVDSRFLDEAPMTRRRSLADKSRRPRCHLAHGPTGGTSSARTGATSFTYGTPQDMGGT